MEEATDVAEILDSTCAAYVVAETEPHAMLIRVVVSLGLQNVALLDDVRDEASRERIDGDRIEEGEEDEDAGLSPDEILHQLDAVTLSADIDDDSDAADSDVSFEDAHDETKVFAGDPTDPDDAADFRSSIADSVPERLADGPDEVDPEASLEDLSVGENADPPTSISSENVSTNPVVDSVLVDSDSAPDGSETTPSIADGEDENAGSDHIDLTDEADRQDQIAAGAALATNALEDEETDVESSASPPLVSSEDGGEFGDAMEEIGGETGVEEHSSESEALATDVAATLDPNEKQDDKEMSAQEDVVWDEDGMRGKQEEQPNTPTQVDQTDEPTSSNTEQVVQQVGDDSEHQGDAHSVDDQETPVESDDKHVVGKDGEEECADVSASSGEATCGSRSESDPEAWVPIEREDELPVLPPPAPVSLPIVLGSMNPASIEDDEDSDSEDENEQPSVPPPLNLGSVDDEDELEIDHAVVSSIQVEKDAKTAGKGVDISKKADGPAVSEKEDSLLATLPRMKEKAGADEIELSFGEEVRVANVVVPPSSFDMPSKSSKLHESPEDSTEHAFGIGYTSLKKKRDEPDSTDSGGYSIASGPAFPDEREFERELELSSDLHFSVKASTLGEDQVEEDGDDEFAPVIALKPDDSLTDQLAARRVSLTVQKDQEEESIINELKKATIEEKGVIDAASPASESGDASASKTQSQDTESALSLKELHGIYKRGLGDQSVLLLDENEQDRSQPQARGNQNHPGAALSVMGRILSKPSILGQAISEEDEEGDEDEEEAVQSGSRGANGDREALVNNTAAHEDDDSFIVVEDWQEIQLAQQSSAKDSGWTASEASKKSHETQDVRDSTPAAHFKISYDEAFQYFSEAEEFLLQRDKIVPEEIGAGRSCFACFSRPRLAFPGALDERDRVFCIAATSYEPRNAVFTKMLQTLYVKLTRTQREVPLSGTHWEDIGFQGSDPSTDLRGCGVLSLLQMLYLVEKHSELAFRFHSLSQHPTRHFPLACALINITLQCIVALRSGALYKECNKHASVFEGINSFYVALASNLMEEIQTSSEEIPITIKTVLEDGRSNPDRVIEQFSKRQSREGGTITVSLPQKKQGNRESAATIAFTEIALQPAASDDE